MMILGIILGILMMIGGIVCMASPLTTYLSTGYFMCAMLFFYGIVGIVRAFQKKASVLEIVTSVLAIIVGLISLFMPGSTLIFDSLMLNLTAAWFIVMGIVSIVVAIKVRKEDSLWILLLISGILGVILGIYSFLHPTVLALSTGMMIGFFFIESGISLIVTSVVLDRDND